jgi:hypothetical protein
MNKHEIQTVKQEAQRFNKDIKISTIEGAVKLELPFTNSKGTALYMFVGKYKNSNKFILLIPVESTGIIAVDSTLAILQKVAATYGVIITPEAVLREESDLSLHKRIRNMTQLLIGVDSIIRLWKVTSNASESTAT